MPYLCLQNIFTLLFCLLKNPTLLFLEVENAHKLLNILASCHLGYGILQEKNGLKNI